MKALEMRALRAGALGALTLVALIAAAPSAQAQLVPDAGWVYDYWTGALPVFTDHSLDPVASGYDLTVGETSLLTITDAFVEGDTFNLYDGGTLLASSTLAAGTTYWATGSVFDTALTSGDFDTLQYVLKPGDYELRIELASGLESGALGVRLDTGVVPEPTTLAMSGCLLALGAVARRR